MRIHEPNRTGMIQAYNKTNPMHQKSEYKHKWGKDEVSISNEGMEMLKMGEEQEMDAARTTKIDDLKNQINNGTYHVSSEKIAEKLLAFWSRS